MTYQRDFDTPQGRVWAAVQALGSRDAAAAAGVSENRLAQLSNPCRGDAA
ncbi:MAG: hypothetical protein HQL35_15490, partial [Alphaproteobacteria bacterium]|nr:hypothetical protein [Alphaproteobacteria bacterium]